jgi:hypothetical protein
MAEAEAEPVSEMLCKAATGSKLMAGLLGQ